MKKWSVAGRLQKEVAWLLLFSFFCLAACAGNSAVSQAAAKYSPESASAEADRQRLEEQLLLPEASGLVVFKDGGITIDASHTDQGYIMIRSEPNEKRLKARIASAGQTYYYDLPSGGTYSVFPLQMGDGTYTIRVMEHVENDLYAVMYGIELDVLLADQTMPFLYPNQYVWYDENSEAVQKAWELAGGLTSERDIAESLYRFVVKSMTYDTEKAKTVQKGYLPDADQSLESGKGICFDYAELLAVMLRAEGIPTKMLIGTVTPENLYHSWNSVYIDGEWVWMDATLDGTGHRESDYITERIY